MASTSRAWSKTAAKALSSKPNLSGWTPQIKTPSRAAHRNAALASAGTSRTWPAATASDGAPAIRETSDVTRSASSSYQSSS